jgi:Flp pilus assembly protein TadD
MAALPPGAQARLEATDPALPLAARLAQAAADGGDGFDTAALARAAIEAAPEDAALRVSMAVVQARIGAHGSAVASAAPLLDAARTDAALADRIGMLGDTLARNGAVEEGCAMLRAAWRASPRPVMLRGLLAAGLPAYRRRLNEGADPTLLVELAEAALAGIATLPEADLVELARLAGDAGRDDVVRALGLAALAAGAPGRAARMGGYAAQAPMAGGLALLATGRGAEAGIAFEAALAAAPGDPAALFNTAMAALAAGDALRAAVLLAALPPCGAEAMDQAAWPRFGELPWPFATPPFAPPLGDGWPRIRLVTPCFNPGPWLEETILSVAAQGYPAVEHVVIDACSTDGTAALLDRHRARLHAVIREADSGPAEAIMKGFAGSDADLLGWINADDVLAPGALHRLGAAFAADPAADIVHGYALPHRGRRLLGVHRALAEGPQGFTTDALADVFGRWARSDFFLQPETLVARGFWKRIGGRLDAGLSAVFDYEMWLRAAAAAPRIVAVPWPVVFYRLHAAQRSAGRAALMQEQVMVRDRFAAPAPPPARDAAIRDALRLALARQPVRLLLVDRRAAETIGPVALADATAALAAQGVAVDVATRLPGDGAGLDLVVVVARAHDGGEWVGTLRAAGFAGPVVGWLVEDDRDPAANQDIARAIDIVVPARAGRRSALLQEFALVLPALPPPGGPTSPHETPAPHMAEQGAPDSTNARHEANPPMALASRLQALVAALRNAARMP